MTVRSTAKFTPEVLLSAPRRFPATPNAAGTLALYSQSTYSFESHSKTSEIHVLNISSGHSTLLSCDSKASGPTWLGDGNEIVWLKEGENGNTSFIVADASDIGKIYTAGTVPGPISNLKLTVLEPGKVAIAVSGQANPDGSLYNPKDVPKPYHSAKIYESLFVRHWDEYVGLQRNAIWYGVLQKSVPHVTERKGRYSLMGLNNALKRTGLESPIPPFGGTDHFDISSSGIVFVAKAPSLDPATHTKCFCYFVQISTFKETFAAEPKKLFVNGLDGASSSPVFSPDGKSIAFLQMEQDGYESDKNRIVIFPKIAEAAGVELFNSEEGGWDRSPSSLLWSNDGKSMFIQAEDMGRGCLFELPLDASYRVSVQDLRKLTHSGYISDVSPAAADSSKLFISSTSLIDNSLFTILDPSSPSHVVKVSSSSKDGAAFGLSPNQISELWWRGANDNPIHAWMVKPSTFKESSKYPLAYLIHGGPQGAWGDQWSTRWNPAVFAEQGYVVICPNPTGSTGYGQAFVDAIQNSWGGLPYEDIVKGFEHIEEKLPYVDTKRSVALGASYGGYMMNWMQGHPLGRKFRALVTHDGVFSMTAQLASDEQYFPCHDLNGPVWEAQENWDRWDPSRFTNEWATPHLIIHNELDYRLTIAEGLAAFNTLQMRGVESAFLTFPDENHWVLKHENSLVWHRCVINWINRYVGLPPILDKDGRDVLESATRRGQGLAAGMGRLSME